MPWTKEQRRAIELSGGNVLVSAAAGSGKTKVLVQRIIEKISDPVHAIDVDRLLVVTFTNAAAAEMRERVGQALNEKILAVGPSRHLNRQLLLLNRATIATIHSFCLEILRQNFYLLDLDPSFQVAEENQARLIQAEAIDALLEEHYDAEDDPDFFSLLEAWGGTREDTPLKELILRLYHFACSLPEPSAWLANLAASFSIPPGESLDRMPWMADLKEGLKLELKVIEEELVAALGLAQKPGGPAPYSLAIKSDLEAVADLTARCDGSWEDLYRCFSSYEPAQLKRCPPEVDKQLKERVKKLRDGAKEKLAALQQNYFCRTPEQAARDLQAVLPWVAKMAELTSEFMERYTRAKRVRDLLDFNDLEHLTLKILRQQDSGGQYRPSVLAEELRHKYEEVLVDEYQDINEVQEAILNLVSRQEEDEPNLFMVGDPKQSIYRFRLAEPGLLQDKYRRYQTGSPESAGCRVDLQKNFRSRQTVINAVNFLFRQLMCPPVGEVAYTTEAELSYGASFPDEHDRQNPAELVLIETKAEDSPPQNDPEEGEPSKENAAEEESDLTASALEARFVAGKIREMIHGGQEVYDPALDSNRLLTYRDIVVLLRATKTWANSFLEEFRAAGIPAYADVTTGYFQATEVEIMLALLKIIDNPRQDIPLAAVLRSPIGGLTAGDLAQIRLAARRGDYWDALMASSLGDGPLNERIKGFLDQLTGWRNYASKHSLSELIWLLYRETGYFEYVGALPGGTARQANLRALYDRARQYEATGFRGLFKFLRFIESLKEQGGDLGEAKSLGENEDVVRIMSIHKSKGLEFPVVFVAGLGKKFNQQDLRQDVLLHKRLGAGPEIVDLRNRVKWSSLPKLAIRHRLKLENLAEELRVLYVALTRAREKLILVGTVKDVSSSLLNWSAASGCKNWSLSAGLLLRAQGYLDWLGPALIRHRDLAGFLGPGEEPPGNSQVYDDPSCWQLTVLPPSRVTLPGGDNPQNSTLLRLVQELKPVAVEASHRDRAAEILSWQYPWQKLAGYNAKVPVSEIKERFGEPKALDEFRVFPIKGDRPAFLKETTSLTAAEIGTATHLVLRHLDLKRVGEEEIRQQVQKLELEEFLRSPEAAAVDCAMLARFFQSALGQRLIASPRVWREIPFSLKLSLKELDDEAAGLDEPVLVQGVVDCLFEEDGELVVVDYKTDQILPEEVPRQSARYTGQLNLYAEAAARILRRAVKASYIFFLEPGVPMLISGKG